MGGMAGSAARLLDATVVGACAEVEAALGSAGTACTLSHDEEAAPVGGMAGSAARLLDAPVVGACAEVKAAS